MGYLGSRASRALAGSRVRASLGSQGRLGNSERQDSLESRVSVGTQEASEPLDSAVSREYLERLVSQDKASQGSQEYRARVEPLGSADQKDSQVHQDSRGKKVDQEPQGSLE